MRVWWLFVLYIIQLRFFVSEIVACAGVLFLQLRFFVSEIVACAGVLFLQLRFFVSEGLPWRALCMC